MFSAQAGVDLEEGLNDVRQVFVGDSRPGVGNRYDDRFPLFPCLDGDATASRREFDGI